MATLKRCSIEGCERPHRTKGFCAIHYNRSINKQDMFAPIRQRNRGKECSVKDCRKAAKTKGMCTVHYRRDLEGGDMEAPIKSSELDEHYSPMANQAWIDYIHRIIPI